jgi:fused signal recognition particle receptor
MEFAGVQIDPQQLIEFGLIAAGLGVTGGLGLLLVRRARASRLRQIEGLAGEPEAARPRRLEGKRPPAGQGYEEDEQEAKQEAAEQEPAEQERKDGRAEGREPARLETEGARGREPLEPGPSPGKVESGTTLVARTAPSAQVIPFTRPRAELDKPAPLKQPTVSPPSEPTAGEPVPTRGKRIDTAALAPGLARTRSGWISRLGQLFAGKREIDPELLDEVEKVLLTADIGVRTSQKLLEEMRSSLSRKELNDADSAWAFLKKRTTELLSLDAQPVRWDEGSPFVLLVIGVNGSGKTTTIGKLAAKLIANGKKVLVGAGDTFRAAAAEQLEVWADRVGATVVRGKEGADPSSVLFEAVKKARTEGFDVVIADTAGRLHTKTDLMEELQKVRRVIGKAAEGAPHETWLVIDATSGQNAIAQAQIFTQAMSVSGIVLTKLDGTAKGGVILGIADQVRIPVRFIGIGERVDDLREFDPQEFVEALYEQ